ncbi:transcriptional regulator [Rhizobium leguminosarum bv. trifolii WSM597]|uniref:HTH-type transcriptional regulator TtuA n=1 Tax=Rhizobium leguminosarum bv. trifolii WSM597 TaxID=754764 RepID=I9NMN7_RHILT|nr:LysR family transcriptional regulator [Rhizobium leguminosarum]EJB08107.1 transcriptional regulator [Rhizobium leguminosarum bv. trifolii WSM597]
MTFEQLAIFVAVAEREHLTKAAASINLTPSAVSTAIKNLEHHYGVELFHRVGRRIELTESGRIFLSEAKTLLARARATELVLSEIGGMQRGTLSVFASQTIASYWLPSRLMRFHASHPGIDLNLTIGNTRTVADAVINGEADVGFVEGDLDEPALAAWVVDQDELVVVVAAIHPWAGAKTVAASDFTTARWVMREVGSGTRSVFEDALDEIGVTPADLDVALVLPSNEAILSALDGSTCAAAVSRLAAQRDIEAGKLVEIDFCRPIREFRLLKHKERHSSKAASTLIDMCRQKSG